MATSTVSYSSGQQKQPGSMASVELRLTDEQQEYLEKQFQKTKNPHPSELMLTAAETGLLEEEVQVSYNVFYFLSRSLLIFIVLGGNERATKALKFLLILNRGSVYNFN